ncbi:IPT/TIG domain-containing protein [Phycicoccus duodecadis]|uniref:IPT/TIG domain-containing protein n=1 Tax=Phycicoccus duodecadis TaxID=173053 RepID=A0A2N3YHA1_9MICO|nr:IPT/TIG domain-containing protein [Phycicoccus duodecadis]
MKVESARTEAHHPGGAVSKGDAVTTYRYMINVDNSGGSSPAGGPQPGSGCNADDVNYLTECPWASIQEHPGAAPIVRQGTEADFADGAKGLTLPEGKYLITVLADDYKIDGEHFSVPMEASSAVGGMGLVTVGVQPDPLPDSTLRAQVYRDEASTNGAIDNGEQGLAGFQGHINDTLGEVTTDVYGNPLCTRYVNEDPTTYEIPWEPVGGVDSRDAEGLPIVATIGGKCFSDADGMLVMPHLGTNRYTTTVTAPDNTDFIQTTTLEGNHDWDTWLMEGATGYDTEATVGGEPVPTPQFGFVEPRNDFATSTAAGSITGVVVAAKQYYPPVGGSFNGYNGMTGSKLDKPIVNPVLSLVDLNNGDQAAWVGRGAADGTFTIPHVPDGNYQLTWWDEPQNYILQLVNVTVANGEAVDLKQLPINGWWTELTGHVFLDTNKNGKRDTGESGVSGFPLTLRKKDNSLMDRGMNAVTTDITGAYAFDSAYPLAEWMIMEAYSDNFYTTGVTYQADNQPTPTTVLGAGVDVGTLNVIGLGGTVDWGVQKYDATGTKGGPRNGGIVGSVSYDTTRNELDPQYAASEDWQPGVPNIPVKLYAPVDCPADGSAPCDLSGSYVVNTDGSYKHGALLNTYVSESWNRPTGCTARDADGTPITHGPGQGEDVLAPDQATTGECLSALVNGVQIGTYATDQGTPDANFGAAVDGNYGFGDGCFDGTLDATDPAAPVCTGGTFTALPAADYIVQVDIPKDAGGKPMYSVTAEEDINIARGDTVVPQVPPPACVGALHTVDVLGIGTDGYGAVTGDGTSVPTGVTVPASVSVDNPTFQSIDGSPYEGMAKPKCDNKLVTLNNGKSIVPMFNIFTDVPIPSRLRGLIVDDLNFSTNNQTVLFGDKAGVPYAPVGIYDFTNRLVDTVESDFNGYYDVLMPSTDHISCPTPSGVCTNLYRFVGNDPGAPNRLNANYDPRFRTIATEFEAMPGVTIPTDLAPTQVGVSIGRPGTSPITVKCMVNQAAPQLFRVSKPFVAATDTARTVTITGLGFGATQGTGKVLLGTTSLATTSWTDTQIVATVPAAGDLADQVKAGAYQLSVTAANGLSTVNGITYHVLGTGYSPTVYEVGPGVSVAAYDPTDAASRTGTGGVSHAIQNALDDADANERAAGQPAGADGNTQLVVVYPNAATTTNPRGAYYENLVMSTPVKLQGVGAGGFQGPDTNSPYVQGTVLDGIGFSGDSAQASDWITKVAALTWDGNQTVNDGAVVSVFASDSRSTAAGRARRFDPAATYLPAIDGFDLRGGDQQGFPGNIDSITGLPTGLPPNISTQGGAVFANAYARRLQITNNVVENNGGAYGTIRIGTPDIPAPDTSQHNEGVRIASNRIVQNAGTNLAGAIGIFAGADGYEVAGNDICGNFSLEYGAGLSVYGLSPDGTIHDNRITLNNSNDEGAGIMMAGELPGVPGDFSPGTGPVDIYANRIQGNLSNDDGGGIRFLMAGDFPMNVHDNVIASNISTHEGAGIAINDAPDVRIYDNTIMDNLTTATAVTSNGLPAPAGVSTSENSVQLQSTLPASAPTFSTPTLFNNVLWNNRAGTRAGTTVTGIGLAGDTSAIDYWDVGVADGTGVLTPVNSVIQQDAARHDYAVDASNSTTDPQVVEPWTVSVAFATWRQNPAFVDATLVAVEAPPDLMGDYHLQGCPASPACDLGAASRGDIVAQPVDIDGDARPSGAAYDAGADEVVQPVQPPPPPVTTPPFVFSTAGNANPPGVTGTGDDADVYAWNGTGYARTVDITSAKYGVPARVNMDGFSQAAPDRFYASFSSDTVLKTPGRPAMKVSDEDVVYWNGTRWNMIFDGSRYRMTSPALDVRAITFLGGERLYFSTTGAWNPPGVRGVPSSADVYLFRDGRFTRVFDARAKGVPRRAVVDGAQVVDAQHIYFSFAANTTLPGIGPVEDEDIVLYDGTTDTWSTWFNGTSHGLTSSELQIDDFSLPNGSVKP